MWLLSGKEYELKSGSTFRNKWFVKGYVPIPICALVILSIVRWVIILKFIIPKTKIVIIVLWISFINLYIREVLDIVTYTYLSSFLIVMIIVN